MSFDKIFSLRNKINENVFGPGKAKVVSDGNKIVANPIDRNSLKVKAVGYQDMIIQGRLTTEGFNGILNWLTRQPDIIDYYYKLRDLKTNFVVYEIMKDVEAFDKQVFKFTIVERSTLPALSLSVNHVSLEEVQMIQKGMGPKDLVVSPSQQLLNDPNKVDLKKTGLTFPIMAAAIPGNKNTNLVAFFRDAYLKIKQEPNVSNYAGLANVKAEINKGELGKATQAFLYALNAGFNIKDWSGEEIAADLTEALATAIMRVATIKAESSSYFLHPNGYSLIKEASAIDGFDPNAFVAGFDQAIKGMGGGTSNTGGIAVPAEGFKYDSTGRLKNAELQKFQEIMMKNLPTYAGGALKTKPAVAAFLRTKADGIYGGKTKGLIGYLKIGLTDPKYPDNDDTTIKADFVNRMLREFKVVTENKTYIGLDGRTLIIEGFDTGAADTGTGGGGGGGNRGGGNRGGGTTVKKESNVKTYELQSPVGWEYTIKNNVWHARKSDGSTGWFLLTNVSSIIKLITTYFNQAMDGYYINLKAGPDGKYKRADDRLYRFYNKKWQVKISGSWQNVDDPKNLNAVYGDPTKAASSKVSSPSGVTAVTIDSELTKLGTSIKSFVEGNSFAAYKGNFDDDEEGAWNDVLYPQWKSVWKKTVASLRSKISSSSAINSSDKSRYEKSLKAIETMFTDGVGGWFVTGNTFFGTFHKGAITSDTWDLMLYLSGSKVKKISIECDF
jgi:hypothetical protein